MKNLGKQEFLHRGFYADGREAIAIMCERTAYEDAKGQPFVRVDGRRLNLIRLPDGKLEYHHRAKR